MTRHYRKKSFLSQAQHDIRGQVRAAKRLEKSLCMFFDIGHTQGEMTAKNIRKTTIYGQGEMINGNSSAKNIREATIYRHVQGEMINRSTSSQSSGHENLNRIHVKDKFTPEVQNLLEKR
ncbi:uncharacterized protein OCT59_021338 [Rhizophagus irregularis]|uniref:Uncharacterized protein n=1 Tax=Rhizophagus irregularis (strain DAOM 181602 / DAOM 197198 / MUCL 43194) TaxID=747089 RepID=A0A2P4QUV1_RHIID|nr:hypothetical protein GLOIN_2v1470777 [Rhizophagus irregularis DAOM 181602=DAOM 197198]POG81392.1 hypothetical protein GLOIN_2v1470777 [Rhizophagus irregularis DAOM 181602=DAOM 197198]UZO02860.1 hypothetical protein OCT59_021338 [Rhizophagus irregularis]GET60520.1 hypothetical protein GLOIN_2v1470777 [Rhizophagus irregularis DAOM 181602=DAOM 197198]CAG8580290.1 10352_t:CDS:2 [Rhizophagus irregularis]|eukprot:XP_025188258.1 hypothetical protein GLOIN_2v1470777 [Rhizophagus irregularis DAOM 181602=DAOM 197198]